MQEKLKDEIIKIQNFSDDIDTLEKYFLNNCIQFFNIYKKLSNLFNIHMNLNLNFLENHYDLEIIKNLLFNPFIELNEILEDIDTKILCFYRSHDQQKANFKFLYKINDNFKEDEKLILKIFTAYKNYINKEFYKKVNDIHSKRQNSKFQFIINTYQEFEYQIKKKYKEGKDLSILKYNHIKKELYNRLNGLNQRLDFLVDKQEMFKNILMTAIEKLIINVNKILINIKNIDLNCLESFDKELIFYNFSYLNLNIKNIDDLRNCTLKINNTNEFNEVIKHNLDIISNNLLIRSKYWNTFLLVSSTFNILDLKLNKINHDFDLKNLNSFNSIFIEYFKHIIDFFVISNNKLIKFYNNNIFKNDEMFKLKKKIKYEINEIKKYQDNIKKLNEFINKNTLLNNINIFADLIENYYFNRKDILKQYKEFFYDLFRMFNRKNKKLKNQFSCFKDNLSINNIIKDKCSDFNEIDDISLNYIDNNFKFKQLIDFKLTTIIFNTLNKRFNFTVNKSVWKSIMVEKNFDFGIDEDDLEDSEINENGEENEIKDFDELYDKFSANNPDIRIDDQQFNIVGELDTQINNFNLFIKNILFKYEFGENNQNYLNYMNELLKENVKTLEPWSKNFDDFLKIKPSQYIEKFSEIQHPINIPFLPKFSLINVKYTLIKLCNNFFILFSESKTSGVPGSDSFINYTKYEFRFESNNWSIKFYFFNDFIKKTYLKNTINRETVSGTNKTFNIFKNNIEMITNLDNDNKPNSIALNANSSVNIKKINKNFNNITINVNNTNEAKENYIKYYIIGIIVLISLFSIYFLFIKI